MSERIIVSDPYNSLPSEQSMEFRLVYSGLLLGASRNDTRSQHKHDIRKVFHHQLKTLWAKFGNLREWGSWEMNVNRPMHERLAQQYKGYVPLSWDGLGLACRLDILMLRPESPGQTLIKGGDIDNRLKTLFDALRLPQLGEVGEPDEGGIRPFFCLLEDDSLINNLSVNTDILLEEVNANHVQLVITVNLWAVSHTNVNMGVF